MITSRRVLGRGFESLEKKAAPAAIISTADVFEFPGTGSGIDEGEAAAVQNANGVKLSLKVDDEDLEAAAYTLWAVIFNDPSECVDGCGLDDVMAGRGDVAITFVDGKVSNGGKINLAGHLSEDPDGPLKTAAAEIHLILRTHGDKDPGRVSEQIHTFEDDCDPDVCANIAAAILQAPEE